MATIDYPLEKCYNKSNIYLGKYDIRNLNKLYSYNDKIYSKLLSDFLYEYTQTYIITIDDLLSGVYN